VLSTLIVIATPGTADYVILAGLLAVVAGVIRLAMGLARLGVLVNFVSHSVIVGFTAGAGVLIVALAGCASMRAAEARDAYLKESMGSHTYRQSCGALWPDVLKLLASQGYSLVGADRAVGGEPRQSAAGNFFSEGFQTRETYAGGLVVATDWNRDWVRYRAEEVLLERDPGATTSARNQLPATVTGLVGEGPLVRVTLDAGFRLVALVTRPGAADLGLAPGVKVVALVKAPAVRLVSRG
jgi:molybdopterin-binding protein